MKFLLDEEVIFNTNVNGENTDPALYAKRCEEELRNRNKDKAIYEINKSIEFSRSYNEKCHYLGEKIKVLYEFKDYNNCINTVKENIVFFEDMDSKKELDKLAFNLYRNEDYKLCYSLVEFIINYYNFPYNREFLFLAGVCSFKMNNLSKSIKYFIKSIESKAMEEECINYIIKIHKSENNIDTLINMLMDLLNNQYVYSKNHHKNVIRNKVLLDVADILYEYKSYYSLAIKCIKMSCKIEKSEEKYYKIAQIYDILAKDNLLIVNHIKAGIYYKKARRFNKERFLKIS